MIQNKNVMVNGVEWIMPSEKVVKKAHELKQTPAFSKYRIETIQWLVNRGIDSKEKLANLLDFNLMHQHDALQMKDAQKFIDELNKAVDKANRAGHKLSVLVWADYDVDGTTAATVFCRSLPILYPDKVKVDWWISSRVEGYGLTVQSAMRMLKTKSKPDLIVTVDNGIVAYDGIKYVQDQGIQVLVTDHHLSDTVSKDSKKAKIPAGVKAAVDPSRPDDDYPLDICGCVVIWKLLLKIAEEKKDKKAYKYIFDLYDFAGLASVADVMPALDDNRRLIAGLINKINHLRNRADSQSWGGRYCYRQLLNKMPNFYAPLKSDDVGFRLAPAINADARMTNEASDVMEMFLSTDRQQVAAAAERLVALNTKRKQITDLAFQKALDDKNFDKKANILVYYAEDLPEDIAAGLVGLLAGKLCEKFYRPAFVIAKAPNSDEFRFSCRSIPGFNITEAIKPLQNDAQNSGLKQCGGHEQAGAGSLYADGVEKFTKIMHKIGKEQLTADEMQPKVQVDFVVDDQHLDVDLLNEIESFAPFGNQFEAPVVMLKDHKPVVQRRFGKDDKPHEDLSSALIKVDYWSGADKFEDNLTDHDSFDMLGSIHTPLYANHNRVEFHILNDEIKPTNMNSFSFKKQANSSN